MGHPTTQRSIDTFMLPTQQSTLLIELLTARGGTAKLALRDTGLTPEQLADDDRWISYRQTMQIIDNACIVCEWPAVGLDVGNAEDTSTLGILGYAMMSCQTVGDAFRVAEQYHRTAQSLCEHQMEVTRDHFTLRATTPFALKPHQYRFAIEELYAGIVRFIGLLSGKKVWPQSVHFAYAQPDYRQRYEELFSCPLVFDNAVNEICFGPGVAELPVLHASEFNARMSIKMCQGILDRYVGEEDLSSRIRHEILRIPGEFPKVQAVAVELNMSSRTMRRVLENSGTSFRQIVNEMRLDLAQQYLRNSNLNIDQVATLLGYTETTNFRRAFKRWLGLSPREYRRSMDPAG